MNEEDDGEVDAAEEAEKEDEEDFDFEFETDSDEEQERKMGGGAEPKRPGSDELEDGHGRPRLGVRPDRHHIGPPGWRAPAPARRPARVRDRPAVGRSELQRKAAACVPECEPKPHAVTVGIPKPAGQGG